MFKYNKFLHQKIVFSCTFAGYHPLWGMSCFEKNEKIFFDTNSKFRFEIKRKFYQYKKTKDTLQLERYESYFDNIFKLNCSRTSIKDHSAYVSIMSSMIHSTLRANTFFCDETYFLCHLFLYIIVLWWKESNNRHWHKTNSHTYRKQNKVAEVYSAKTDMFIFYFF